MEFKVGDKVERVGPSTDDLSRGEINTISDICVGLISLAEIEGAWLPRHLKLHTPAWTPQQGEMVEVMDGASGEWMDCPVEFICMYKGDALVRSDRGNFYNHYTFRQIPKTTITIDGESYEVDVEKLAKINEILGV